MQFTMSQVALSQGLSIVSSAVDARPAQPISGHILARREGRFLSLLARNEEYGVRYRLPVEHWEGWGDDGSQENPSKALLPAALATYVRQLPHFPVTVTLLRDQASCLINCQRASSRLTASSDNPDEFPPIAVSDGTERRLFQLEAGLLSEIIHEVAFVAGEDIGRSLFTALCMEIEKGQVTFVAASTFRIALYTVPILDDSVNQTILVSARVMRDLAGKLSRTGLVDVALTADEHQLLVHAGPLDFSTRTLSGVFPPFRKAIPQSCVTRARFRTEELLSAIRLAQPFANKENKEEIVLTLWREDEDVESEDQSLQIHAAARDVGSNENAIAAHIEGPTQTVALNAGFVADALESIQEPEAEILCGGPRTSVVIQPVGPRGSKHVLAQLARTSYPMSAVQERRAAPALAAR